MAVLQARDAAEAVGVQAQQGRDPQGDGGAVGDHHDGAAGVLGDQLTAGGRDPLAHRGSVLHAQSVHGTVGAPVGVLGRPVPADLFAAQALPAAEAALEERLVGGDVQPRGVADDRRGVTGPLQRGGDEEVRRVLGDRGGEHGGLPGAGLVQRDVDLPLQASLAVVVRLPVAHEDETGAHVATRGVRRPHAEVSSSICRSMTGASRHRRSSA
ncbi:hypothetical protein GCM10009626_01450 [Brachybacterium sacelli]